MTAHEDSRPVGYLDAGPDAARLAEAIRGSDYSGLDILPSNLDFRDFDILLSRLKNRRSRLRKALSAVVDDYDVILLDCPPGLSTLSESVFRAADAVLVPVIPTTLSWRSFDQVMQLFADQELPVDRLIGLFSMVQKGKRLHADVMERLRADQGSRFLSTSIPVSADVERMGVTRAPVLATLPTAAISKTYESVAQELAERIALHPRL